jgi:hypothetical protein
MDESSIEESNENENSHNNRPKAEQDPMEKSDDTMHVEVEDDLKSRTTQAAPDEGNGAMELDDTSNKGFEIEDKNLESKTTFSQNNETFTNADDMTYQLQTHQFTSLCRCFSAFYKRAL